jgi:Protein of unknown function (DUF2839)
MEYIQNHAIEGGHMGEAKRRKQMLGENYGKTVQPVIRGSEDLEQHVERFYEAWYQYLEDLGLVPDSDRAEEDLLLEPAAITEKQQRTKQWIQEYLQPYRSQDRDRLACGILDPVYEDLANIIQDQKGDQKSDEERIEEVMTWMVEATSYFGLFKPYLSAEIVQKYQEPLQSFYEMAIAESKANQDEEGVSLLTSIFADSLDLQESPE